MSERPANIVNVADVAEQGSAGIAPWKPLTPALSRPGALGLNLTRLPKGHTACPFHYHLREDEVFYILSGRGVLRYGDALHDVGAGDCISCPAGTGVAHQLANPYDEDLVYLAIGPNDPHEVCVYPDSGKVMVRGLKQVGYLRQAAYMDGEPEPPKIFELIAAHEQEP
ncbi:cupin domain-containing protein [Nannocystis punicea]|uniref:Cupin domain-containing protein n=1 Tax=Nannocystis punicea TaxID=2995304 RepID=A0ABY7HA18_9BACT|nr:cupin domain-containing protein [Nannocystis poenicansa]WAS95988.1 cupin domain-containing protein [Nannocystis poenicansa]